MPKVLFATEGRSVNVPEGTLLIDAARRAGVCLYSGLRKLLNCRGHGRCGGCKVTVTEGSEQLTPTSRRELRTLTRGQILPDRREQEGRTVRLACQARVLGPVVIHSHIRRR